MARDLTAWAEAAQALADRATPGEWWASLAEEDSDEYDEVIVGTVERGDLHTLAIGTYGPLGPQNVQVMAAGPVLARTLAAVLRAAMADGHAHCKPGYCHAISRPECPFVVALAPLASLFPESDDDAYCSCDGTNVCGDHDGRPGRPARTPSGGT